MDGGEGHACLDVKRSLSAMANSSGGGCGGDSGGGGGGGGGVLNRILGGQQGDNGTPSMVSSSSHDGRASLPSTGSPILSNSGQQLYPEDSSFYPIGHRSGLGPGGSSGTSGGGGLGADDLAESHQHGYSSMQWPGTGAGYNQWRTASGVVPPENVYRTDGVPSGSSHEHQSQHWGFAGQGMTTSQFISNSSPLEHAAAGCLAGASSSSDSLETAPGLGAVRSSISVSSSISGMGSSVLHSQSRGVLQGVSGIGSGIGSGGIGSALGLDGPGGGSGVGGSTVSIGMHLGSLMSGISGSPAYPPYPGSGGVGTGIGGGGGGGTHGGYHAPVTLPGLGFYSPQIAAQRVMSEGRMGVNAAPNPEKLEPEEKEQWNPSEEEVHNAPGTVAMESVLKAIWLSGMKSCWFGRASPRPVIGSKDDRELTPEEKLERSRIRNRDHSRKSRQRKKALVEGMKKQVTELGAYRMLVEQAHDLISAHTTDDRALFLYASGAYSRLLGIDPQDLMGIQLVHMVHPEDSARVTDAIRNALLYNNQVIQVRYRLRHQTRGEHTVETSFRLVPTRLLAVTRVHTPSFPPPIRH